MKLAGYGKNKKSGSQSFRDCEVRRGSALALNYPYNNAEKATIKGN
jgi:hypothetical protein